MPVLFVSHGSPMLALDKENGKAFSDWAKSFVKPNAILVFSAHWETDSLAFGEIDKHQNLVYDFGGFPKPLYEVQYPAPGAPHLVDLVESALLDYGKLRVNNRGLDHGVWVPFLHMWPGADVPILQMTMPHTLSNQALFELGERLSPLKEQGILITGNGTLTHNLREWRPDSSGVPADWAVAFDKWVKQSLVNKDYDALINWEKYGPQAQRNHPTPEHFRPLLIAMGAAKDEKISFPIEGFEYSIFSKRSVQFG